MRSLLLLLSTLSCTLSAQGTCGSAQTFQILHYTETADFDHNTRSQSLAMFDEIGVGENFTVVDTEDHASFDDLTYLEGFEVIVFANTSGNIDFTDAERANLEAYVDGGGAVLGIHAATDMYRDGSWFYFSDLMGGSRRNNPAHTSNNFNGTMDLIGSHPSTAGLPDPWAKQEEYYYWPDSGLVAGITEVLRVRDTGNNSFNDPRPMSWYQEFVSGGRSFYSALGHARSNYTDANNDFRLHLRNALCWCAEASAEALPVSLASLSLRQVKATNTIAFTLTSSGLDRVELYGGFDQTSAQKLATLAGDDRMSSSFEHTPDERRDYFYYRLRFVDLDGSATWSEWLTAAPNNQGALPRVQYGDQEIWLDVPQQGPKAAWVVDAAGRKVLSLQLREGKNRLEGLRPGVHFIRFPFGAEAIRFIVR